jgi:threonine dehydrogenase-like Zn-dependent dehydrogenase
LLLSDIASTGCGAVERGRVRLGDTVAVFAQGPIGLCATLGARLRGASEIFAVDTDPDRLQMARRFGATGLLLAEGDVVREIREFTGGRGVDVAIEALGTQQTFESALRVLRPGGNLSSVGVYSGHLRVPLDAFGAGLGDHTIVTTLCPGGKERMRRLMRLVEAHRIDLKPLFTHSFKLDEIDRAYELFGSRSDKVLKVAIRVSG